MRELTFFGVRSIAWREVPEPTLQGPREALVRPIVAGRCDGDAFPLFYGRSNLLRAGLALHLIDPILPALLGPRPFAEPFPLGHECVARVVQCGEAVHTVQPGQLVIVPWAISCGACAHCSTGLTSHCSDAGPTHLNAYGFGPSMGPWGGAVSDLLRVPYADAMLVPLPPNADPLQFAAASDNLPDAWRTVAPYLERDPTASVLIVGGGARSIGLYAAGIAAALGSPRVDYLDHDPERLRIAQRLGATPIEVSRGSRWFNRNAPQVHGRYAITVEANSTAAGLRYALRSLAPGGTCTAVGYYLNKSTGLPLLQMYANSATLRVGISHPRAVLPQLVDLIAQGRFDPRPVTTLLADWDDAPEAYVQPATKLVLQRRDLNS